MSSRKLIIATLTTAALMIVAAYGYKYLTGDKSLNLPMPVGNQSTNTNQPSGAQSQNPQVTNNEVVVKLEAQSGSTQSGTVTFKDNGQNQTMVVVKLENSPKGVIQPAHIHQGSCPDVGLVKYPLASVVDGLSSSVASVSLSQLLTELPLAVNVHKSVEKSKEYVSCGNITSQ